MIRIVRNESANCITFEGTSVPAYFNACLSGEVSSDDPDKINIKNDIRSNNQGEDFYEFSNIHYTEFEDRDGNLFESAQKCADYITSQGNVLGLNDVGKDLTGTTVNFRLDQTNTSIIMDNGEAFGVNTIKAVPEGGLIKIKSIGEGIPTDNNDPVDRVHFEGLDHTLVKINGSFATGGLNDVINKLNELFTVGAFESVVISDPYSTMVADVSGVDAGYTLEGSTAIDPVGDDVFTNSSSGNYAGLKSTATINQAGEYFTFDIRGEGQIGFGLVHTQDSFDDGYFSGSSIYADPTSFAVGNSAHYGFQFSHWFHPTPNGSWTNYGANTAYSMRSGWSSWKSQNEWLAGDPVKIKVGIDENGFISISSLQDDNTTWIVHARTTYPVAQGSEFHLGIKTANSSARVFSAPKVHLLEETAPTMYFRYIESPDGSFNFPLFATEEEANYYDSQEGGSGTSTTKTYADDPTSTTWYMPDTNNTDGGSSAPDGTETFESNLINWTEITSLTDADLAPPAFSNSNISQEEGTAVNIPLMPADVVWSQTVSITPSGSGLVYNTATGFLQGTLADVGADTTYTVTVTRANSYGSSTGSFTITATDVPPVNTNDTPWTKALDFSGSSERAQIVSSSYSVVPLKMGGTNNQISAPTTIGNTTNGGHPWATAVVFRIDGNSSNQHIWNLGEGSGSTDDNIYLRVDANRNLYFGWGRTGDYNELFFGSLNVGTWYGCYIGHNGTRYGSGNTAAQLADAFDVRLYSDATNWQSASAPNSSTSTMWGLSQSTVGGRMNREYQGDFTIGGRGANRNFHGKVASMVVTTLKCNVAMPDTTEIEMMIKDPIKWIQDYKEGNTFRQSLHTTTNTSWNSAAGTTKAFATQVWLMGDGTNDSYSNMIRNQVFPTDQNYTKLNLISMVSSDIQTVNINGLT